MPRCFSFFQEFFSCYKKIIENILNDYRNSSFHFVNTASFLMGLTIRHLDCLLQCSFGKVAISLVSSSGEEEKYVSLP